MYTERINGNLSQVAEEIRFKARFVGISQKKKMSHGNSEYYHKFGFRFKPKKKILQYDKESTKMIDFPLVWFDPKHELQYSSEWASLFNKLQSTFSMYNNTNFCIHGSFYTYEDRNFNMIGPIFKPTKIYVLNTEKTRIL